MFITKFEFQVALAYLRIRKFRGIVSFLSFLGITIGVAILIIVTSVMNGFREELFFYVAGASGHINILNNRFSYNELKDVAKPIYSIKGVRNIVFSVESQSIIIEHGITTGVIVKGMKTEDILAENLIDKKIIAGTLENYSGGIIIGSKLASDFGISVGDSLTFISPDSFQSFMGRMPRMKKFKIAAIFSLGMQEYDNSLVYMPFDIASVFFNTNGRPNLVNIYVNNLNDAKKIADIIKSTVELPIIDWQSQQSAYYNAFQVEKKVMFIILALIILIAIFNIISSLFMLVDEKKQSIAILRTLGMTRFAIIKIFILCGFLIGLVGTLVGSIIGILFVKNINKIRAVIESFLGEKVFDPLVYSFSNIPYILDPFEVGMIIFMTLIFSFIATIPAAYKASLQEPSVILR